MNQLHNTAGLQYLRVLNPSFLMLRATWCRSCGTQMNLFMKQRMFITCRNVSFVCQVVGCSREKEFFRRSSEESTAREMLFHSSTDGLELLTMGTLEGWSNQLSKRNTYGFSYHLQEKSSYSLILIYIICYIYLIYISYCIRNINLQEKIKPEGENEANQTPSKPESLTLWIPAILPNTWHWGALGCHHSRAGCCRCQ